MATKVFFYTLRPYDELGIAQRLAPQLDVEFGSTQEYPTLENAELAKGYDAVSVTPCDMSTPMVKRFHELGVKSICCRSIGYDHVDRETARELGMKVANVDYPPNGVANFAIMLMLMSLRKAGHILKRGEAQDYSLQGKIGRDISTCTVGVIGTGRIGRTVLQHLSGFGCRLLAYDLYPNDEVKKIAEYVPLETLLAESNVITLHTNATEENHHLIDTKAIESMKPGVTIINTARGKLIDSDALIAGLESSKIGAAGLDVLENENGLYYYNRMGDVIPNPELAALRSMPNVIGVGEMRSAAESLSAAESSRTGHTVCTTIHSNSCNSTYRRMMTLAKRKYSMDDSVLMEIMVEAYPIVVFTKQLEDRSRKIMEILEGEDFRDGQLVSHTLYKFEVEDNVTDRDGNVRVVGHHRKVGLISDTLKKRLLDNGISNKELAEFMQPPKEVD